MLNMVDDIPSFRWPGKQDEEWHLPMNKVKRAKMEDVLKQVGNRSISLDHSNS